jgi:hypothetical protein
VTILLALLRRYWLHIFAVAGLAAWAFGAYLWAYGHGVTAERAKWLAKENKALVAAVAERDKAQAERNAARSALDELAKHPPKVVTVVRANPSGCNLPAPVADAIRVQVDAVNEAIRKGRVPGADSAP